jgi:hypothetical protein
MRGANEISAADTALGGGFFTFSVDDTYIKCFMAVCALCCVISFFLRGWQI